jgi:putative Holliday junction resolvase
MKTATGFSSSANGNRQSEMSSLRTLAIDLGSRRIGLALSDEGGKFATPYDVLTVTSPDDALAPIQTLIAKESVRRVVVGLPLNMDDTIGPAARAVIQWSKKLGEKVPVPILFVDERLSTFSADQRLTDRKRAGEKLTRGQKKQMLDAHAAAGFLQEFLDGKLPSIQASGVDDQNLPRHRAG